MGSLRGHDHFRGDGREQRRQSQRRHGRHVCRQQCHYRRGVGHFGLRQFALRVRRLPQHHVYTRFARASGVLLCLHRRAHRFPLVQRLPGASVYGRYGFAYHWRHYRRGSHHHSQRTAAAHTLRHLLRRELERDVAGVLFQDGQTAGRKAAHI